MNEDTQQTYQVKVQDNPTLGLQSINTSLKKKKGHKKRGSSRSQISFLCDHITFFF